MGAIDPDVLQALNPTAAGASGGQQIPPSPTQAPAARSGAIDTDILSALNPSQQAPAARRTPIAIPEAPGQRNLAESALGAGVDVAMGLGETAVRGALGFAGQMVGGAASYAGRFLPGGDWDRAQRWADQVQQDVSTLGGRYTEPHSTTGKAIESAMGTALGWIPKAAGAAGQRTLEATGSPGLASTVDAAIQALPQIAGAKLVQRLGTTARTGASNVPLGTTLAPDSIVKAPAASGQAVVGGTSAPELAEALKKAAPTVETPSAPLPEATPHAITDLPPDEIAARQAVLARVGHQNARTSAVTGNGPATMFDYDSAKSPTAAGQMMRQQIDSETATNAAFADQIQQKTGGSTGLDQTALANRGNVIDAARDALQQWHDNQVRTQYAAARDALGDTPVTIPSVIKAAGDPLAVGGTVEGAALRAQLQSTLKKLGMVDEDGKALPISVNQAEGLRQWLGDSWTPRTNRFITALKAGLDNDVTSVAGQDVFESARAARTLQAQQLDHPAFDKIAKLSDAGNPEAIPDAVAHLPSDQLAHVVNTLQKMPEGLQPAGTAALNEIAGHFANRIAEAGTPRAVGGAWSDIGVSKYLANNNARLAQVFTPEGMQMIGDLNQAGKITAMDKRYVGAAGQTQNFAQRGLVFALPKLGALGGGAIGGVFGHPAAGAAIGAERGAAAAASLQDMFARRGMQGRIQPLGPGPITPAQP